MNYSRFFHLFIIITLHPYRQYRYSMITTFVYHYQNSHQIFLIFCRRRSGFFQKFCFYKILHTSHQIFSIFRKILLSVNFESIVLIYIDTTNNNYRLDICYRPYKLSILIIYNLRPCSTLRWKVETYKYEIGVF